MFFQIFIDFQIVSRFSLMFADLASGLWLVACCLWLAACGWLLVVSGLWLIAILMVFLISGGFSFNIVQRVQINVVWAYFFIRPAWYPGVEIVPALFICYGGRLP